MVRKHVVPFVLLSVCSLGGCESSETATKLAKLQEQIGRVAQQLNETKKQVDGLQEANQRSVRALENLEAVVERFNSASAHVAPSRPAKTNAASVATKLLAEQDLPSSAKQPGSPVEVLVAKATPVDPQATGEIGAPPFPPSSIPPIEETHSAPKKEAGAIAASVPCGVVWKHLGQGKSPEAAARALNVSVAAIQACEQKIGRNGR
jgi:hypothetical protein